MGVRHVRVWVCDNCDERHAQDIEIASPANELKEMPDGWGWLARGPVPIANPAWDLLCPDCLRGVDHSLAARVNHGVVGDDPQAGDWYHERADGRAG